MEEPKEAELSPEELEEQDVEELPERAAMSVIDPGRFVMPPGPASIPPIPPNGEVA